MDACFKETVCFNNLCVSRGVHLGDRGGFGRVSFDSVVFRIDYFLDACYGGSHSGRVG